jgi:hypothetical protein
MFLVVNNQNLLSGVVSLNRATERPDYKRQENTPENERNNKEGKGKLAKYSDWYAKLV